MSLMQDEYCITGKPADAESEYEPAYRKHAFSKDSINKIYKRITLLAVDKHRNDTPEYYPAE